MATIFKRGNKLYLEFFDINKNKTRQKSTGLEDTKSNRVHLTNIIIPQLEHRQQQEEPKPMVKKIEYYIDFYLKTKENLVTYFEILSKTNSILEHFGNVPITEISPLLCKDYILSLSVSTKTKRNYLNVLSGIFAIACEDLAIRDNPTKYIKLIKTQQELSQADVEPFSKDDIQNLLNNSSGILKDYLGISLYTGARPGELLALKIEDIDFVSNTISISKQYTARKLKDVLKTKGSKRVIPLFSNAIPYFNSLIKNAKSNMSSYLFARDTDSTLYSIDNIRGKKEYGKYTKLLEACDLSYRKIYNTRHTFAIYMLQSGFLSASEIAQILGHTSSKTMFDHYAKFIKGEQLKINRNIDIFA
ncbi:MAG: hypothetical protein DRG78_03355 [Epsilonproteobacteria bacterium]|nr:MAG: hypothetical protein DRG78_03355 [Campylobacterota bacterium]